MFNIYQTILDEHGDIDGDRVEAYGVGLMGEFTASPEANAVAEADGDPGWAEEMVRFGIEYLGVTPGDMSVANFRELLFELIPRKVSTPPEAAPEIITSLRAFWSFVERQYGLPVAKDVLAELGDDAVIRLKKELADPGNWGMAKSIVMLGQKAGFDMTTQAGVDAFVQVCNRSLPAAGFAPPDDQGGWVLAPARPKKSSSHESRLKARKKQRQARKRSRK